MTATQEKVFALLRVTTPKGCESCAHSHAGYCESPIGCDWVEELFFARHNSWAGYEQDTDKLQRRAERHGDLLDAAEIAQRIKAVKGIRL